MFFQKSGGMVSCSGQIETTMNQWEIKELCSIPEGFRPSFDTAYGVFVNSNGIGRVMAYGDGGDHPNELYAMAINAITSNSIIFALTWATDE